MAKLPKDPKTPNPKPKSANTYKIPKGRPNSPHYIQTGSMSEAVGKVTSNDRSRRRQRTTHSNSVEGVQAGARARISAGQEKVKRNKRIMKKAADTRNITNIGRK